VIEEVTGTQVWIGKQRKGQELCTVGIKGMNECIQQAQRLISVVMNEPEKFDEAINKFKAAKSGKPALTTQACSAGLNKSPTATNITSLVLQSKGIRTATTTPTTPPPSYNMNELAPSSPSQPSVSMAATSIANMSALTSCTNSTSADQDFSPFNRPLSKAEGTSMPGIYTSGMSINFVDTAQDPGYRSSLNAGTAQSSQNLNSIRETVLYPTFSASITPIPSLGSNKAPVGSRPHLLPSSPCTGSLPQQKTVPTLGMEGKVPSISTASLDHGGSSTSITRRRRGRPHKQTQDHIPKCVDVLSMLYLDGLAPQAIGPMKIPGQTFSLAPGVGRPSRYVCFVCVYF